MASQLAIELTCTTPEDCIINFAPAAATAAAGPPIVQELAAQTTRPTYQITNVNLIPEIIEFDQEYDRVFLKGLQSGGVPIKFSSWHTYRFSTGGSSIMNLQIQERSRSVKSIYAVQRRGTPLYSTDSGALLFCSSSQVLTDVWNPVTLQSYQYRIGGR